MPEAVANEAPPAPSSPHLGLLSRLLGVITSPRATYADVAARPRVLGALLVTALIGAGSQFWFLSTESGKKATLDAIEGQIRMAESFGANVDDATYKAMTDSVESSRYSSAGAILAFSPVSLVVLAAIFMGVFNAMLGGNATFKQMCAVLAHAGVIWTLPLVFNSVVGFFTGRIGDASKLSVFTPMLESGFLAHLLGYLDLFWFWGLVSTAIGLAVLYRRRTGPIATTLLLIYVTIGVLYAAVRTMLAGSGA
jgi:hypothetical protein